jgi:tetratricopeptide (TPR) repeat protein
MGQFEAGISALRRAVVLDPLNPESHNALGQGLHFSHRYEDAVAAFTEAITLDPDHLLAYGRRGRAYYVLGDLNDARSSCEARPDNWLAQWCLAMVYDKLRRRTDAEAEVARMQSTMGDAETYQYATIYAQWNITDKAFEWLETAMRLHDSGLEGIKTDPLLDPLRNEPRFKAIERELKFPE